MYDSNQTAQLQKLARALKFWIEQQERFYYKASQNKDTDTPVRMPPSGLGVCMCVCVGGIYIGWADFLGSNFLISIFLGFLGKTDYFWGVGDFCGYFGGSLLILTGYFLNSSPLICVL